MLLKLIHPVEFDGKEYASIKLSDYMKTRHQLAFADARAQGADDDDLGFEAACILMASFCEDLPAEAVKEISIDDQEAIGAHIDRVTRAFSERKGANDSGKKPRIIPISPVIQPKR